MEVPRDATSPLDTPAPPPWRPGTAPTGGSQGALSRREAMLAILGGSGGGASGGSGSAAAAEPAVRRSSRVLLARPATAASPERPWRTPPASGRRASLESTRTKATPETVAEAGSPPEGRTPGSAARRRRSSGAGSGGRPSWVSTWRASDVVSKSPAPLRGSAARPATAAGGEGSAALPPPRASPAATLRFSRPRTAPPRASLGASGAPPGHARRGSGGGGVAGSPGGTPLRGSRAEPPDEWGLPVAPPASAAAAAAAAALGAAHAAAAAIASPGPAPPPTPGGTNTTLAMGYALGAVVGQGGFCKVRLGTHALTGATVAVKVIDKAALTDANDRRRVGREVRVLRRLACGAVIRLFDVVAAPAHIFVVMEYAAGGSLLDHVRGAGRLGEAAAARVFAQLLAGVAFCHSRGVIHRDVKLENALLDRDGAVKLIDFGLAALVPSLDTPLRVHCGSPSYAAPEIVARKPYLGPPVDVWSLGVVLFACAAGYLPFHAPPGNKTELSAKILKGTFTLPDGMSPELATLLRSVLVVEPAARADVAAIQASPWLAAHAAEVGAAAVQVQAAPATADDVDAARCDALAALGCDRQALVTDLLAGETNYLTAAYHLHGAARSDAQTPQKAPRAAQQPAPPPPKAAAFGSPLAAPQPEEPATPTQEADA